MTTREKFILTDHAVARFEERFGDASIRNALAEALPYGGNQKGGSRMLISPTLGCVFCLTPDGVVTTALTEQQALGNIQKNGKGKAAHKWKAGVPLPASSPKEPESKPKYVFDGQVSESWPEMVKAAEREAVSRITSEYTKDSFHEVPTNQRNGYIKRTMRECGVPCSGSVYNDHKSNVLFACYKVWRGESV